MLEPFCIYSVYNTTKEQYDKEIKDLKYKAHNNKITKVKKVLTKK